MDEARSAAADAALRSTAAAFARSVQWVASACAEHGVVIPARPRVNRNDPTGERTAAVLAAMAAGERSSAVARRLGLSQSAVIHILHRHGVRDLVMADGMQRQRPQRYAALAEAVAAGKTVEEVSRELGASPHTVRTACGVMGVLVPRKQRSAQGPRPHTMKVLALLMTTDLPLNAIADSAGVNADAVTHVIILAIKHGVPLPQERIDRHLAHSAARTGRRATAA